MHGWPGTESDNIVVGTSQAFATRRAHEAISNGERLTKQKLPDAEGLGEYKHRIDHDERPGLEEENREYVRSLRYLVRCVFLWRDHAELVRQCLVSKHS